MPKDTDPTNAFRSAISAFTDNLASQVHDRWVAWVITHENRHVDEVVGGLLARQVTLATELALNPPIWNAHLAPLILRSMVENCITIAWILRKPSERAEQFVAYGLGQESLLLEQAKAGLQESGVNPTESSEVESWERWLNGQRFTFLTEVNVGNWALSLREMADEVGMLDLHRNDYARWSGTVHNMWHHVVRYNLQYCSNPLHGNHRVPIVPKLTPSPVLLQKAAEYVEIALKSFDEKTGIETVHPSPVDVLGAELAKMPQPPGNV